jgi:Relaxase/Mobilisation nuclease domain
MTKRVVRLPRDGVPMLDIHAYARIAFLGGRLSPAQVAQIARTVRRVPEVMLKITGGGTTGGAVKAHLDYISRKGRLEIETDTGDRIARDQQKAFLADWHLELSAGQYRKARKGQPAPRATRLVKNIVLSMPHPTPPEKVLAAARAFAREKFAGQHRYAMVMHTDQQNPHVHLVVKSEDNYGHKLHIDKPMLSTWREDFARLMREQGIAANATPRFARGQNKRKAMWGGFRAQRHGSSTAILERVKDIAKELAETGTIRDPERAKLMETRKAVISSWMKTADALDAQGEVALARDVRYFANHLPSVLTDKERLAIDFIRHRESRRSAAQRTPEKPTRDRGEELTR